ncbi:MAG: hypothetical protein H6852_03480 [Geminicoccaceae bacterium]|jgi:hypothetical protein|nr:hypothetical protein [Geminicoccaceae bacterium]MCB9966687.1 hypothetical protein [Geminicoccaceae bacterium]HRY26834.1 hypothetical protein [Geminicoccaceae bacterium]
MNTKFLAAAALAAVFSVSAAETSFAQAENCLEYMPTVQAKFDGASAEAQAKAKDAMDAAIKAQSENNEEACLEHLHMADQQLGGQ